jgi:hypothetical protein
VQRCEDSALGSEASAKVLLTVGPEVRSVIFEVIIEASTI